MTKQPGMTRKISNLFRIIPFIAGFPYFVLAFFARPAADDLTPNFYTNRYGIVEMCKQTYLHLSGRFFSMSVFLSLTSSRVTFSYYFLVPLCLILLFITATSCALKSINKYYLKVVMPGIELVGYAVLFLLIYLAAITDVASSFYWMAAGIIYQLPIILFLFFVSTYTAFLNTGSIRFWMISAALVFFIFGSNEIIIFLMYPLIALFTVFCYFNRTPYRHYTLILTLVATVSSAFLLFSPAVNGRSSALTAAPGLLYVTSAGLVQFLMVIIAVMDTPVFWSVLLLVILNFPILPFQSKNLKIIMIFASAILCFSLTAYFIVFKFKDNGLPGRANNLFSFSFLLSMFLYAVVASVKLKEKLAGVPNPVIKQVASIIFLITIFTNSNYKKALKDIVSGFVFSRVYDKRIDIIQQAVSRGKHSVELNDYDFYWDDFVNKNIPGVLNKPFKKLVPLYPGSVFICDDLAEKDWDNGFAEYYNIDTIFVNNKIVLRHSIVKGLQK
jgi:hypothetical protein